MRTLMDGQATVAYSQIYVVSEHTDLPPLQESFLGQRNGLCGAATPGALFLITGLHTGEIGCTVQEHDGPPPVDDAWEEIVEVSFRPAGTVSLVAWAGEGAWPLALRDTDIDYRVRYCGSGMDAASEQDTLLEGEPEIDRYLLQFWPAPPAPDEVLKQTGRCAANWHDFARRLPPPPTPEELAAQRAAAIAEHDAKMQARQDAAELRQWGGELPSERLRALGYRAMTAALLDRDLAEGIAAADTATQRAIARWLARRAYEVAGLADLDWIAPALAAQERGEELPAPFDGKQPPFDTLWADPRVPHSTVTTLDGRYDNFRQQAMAFPAILSAEADDPLDAALQTLRTAAGTFGRDRYPELLAELRAAFPVVTGRSH